VNQRGRRPPDPRPVRYRWKDDPEARRKIGLIAQEVITVVPEAVTAPENPEELSNSSRHRSKN